MSDGKKNWHKAKRWLSYVRLKMLSHPTPVQIMIIFTLGKNQQIIPSFKDYVLRVEVNPIKEILDGLRFRS